MDGSKITICPYCKTNNKVNTVTALKMRSVNKKLVCQRCRKNLENINDQIEKLYIQQKNEFDDQQDQEHTIEETITKERSSVVIWIFSVITYGISLWVFNELTGYQMFEGDMLIYVIAFSIFIGIPVIKMFLETFLHWMKKISTGLVSDSEEYKSMKQSIAREKDELQSIYDYKNTEINKQNISIKSRKTRIT